MECVHVIKTSPTVVAFIFEGILLVGGKLYANYVMPIKQKLY